MLDKVLYGVPHIINGAFFPERIITEALKVKLPLYKVENYEKDQVTRPGYVVETEHLEDGKVQLELIR